ncbi:MAG: UvrD-helicase domain-containing protein [Bacteroidales bacterium]|jgi:ATP-dependent helicase/nuclease subunit A|nr:UvrD-helicase domain-containing protein [Bacteroidales bacterium]MCI1733481.1 UvrD-helicase domain-containing protein [Bacteroidales bacterium]
MSENKNNILICRASAGSGKTYKLTGEYKKLVIDAFANKNCDDAYKHILAVTFTNKATDEMKGRILQTLYEVSKSGEDREKEIAKDALRKIVHDYTMFRVSTIDSFFQGILKAFALELRTRSAYETSLDDNGAIDAAVENLYVNLDKDPQLLNLLSHISLSRVDDEKSWDARGVIKQLAQEIFKESYKSFKADDSVDFGKLAEHLRKDFVEKFVGDVEKIFNDGREIMSNAIAKYSISSDDFAGKSRSPLYKFFAGGYSLISAGSREVTGEMSADLSEFAVNFDKWPNNKISPDHLSALKELYGGEKLGALCNNLSDCLLKLQERFAAGYSYYSTAKHILANIDIISLFKYIKREVEAYCQKEQIALLSEAPDLLHDLIDGSDTPFVYEKIGTKIDNFLLDEFQDTSGRQWENFKPLLMNSSSEGCENLIVGDVKQSIYRWRGGDWNILKSNLGNEFDGKIDSSTSLSENYRSLEQIVEFNNAFFKARGDAPQTGDAQAVTPLMAAREYIVGQINCGDDAISLKTADRLLDIYSDSKQVMPAPKGDTAVGNKKKGLVEVIDFVAPSRNAAMKFDDFVLPDMLEKIKMLTDKNGAYRYENKDIAVLVTSNVRGAQTASFLLKNEVNVISGDSLFVCNSRAVKVLINVLRKVNDASDKNLEADQTLFGDTPGIYEKFNAKIEENPAMKDLSLYEICQEILGCFTADLLKDVSFIQAFMDTVLDYSVNQGANLGAFIKWWDENGSSLSIPEPPDKNAVRIMTMHKAKGLAFKVVFIPFLRENLISYNRAGAFGHSSRIWCATDDKNIGYAGPLLLNFDHDLYSTVFRRDFERECVDSAIDTVNLAYVSFTRAKEKLYIYANNKESSNKGNSVSKVSGMLEFFCQSAPGITASVAAECSERMERSDFKRAHSGATDAQTSAPHSGATYGAESSSGAADKRLKPCHCVTYTFGDAEEPAQQEKEGTSDDSYIAGENLDISEFTINESVKGELKNELYGEGDDMRHRGIVLHRLYSFIGAAAETAYARTEVAVKPGERMERSDFKRAGSDATSALDRQIEAAVDKITAEGTASVIADSKEKIVNLIKSQINSVDSYGWFSNDYQPLNETSILIGGSVYRPDRVLIKRNGGGAAGSLNGNIADAVVVDYKFGEYDPESRSHAGYQNQVRNYMNLLSRMGYAPKGYLWYVTAGKVAEVK